MKKVLLFAAAAMVAVSASAAPEKVVLATYFDGNGNAFGGWGGTFEQVEEDGKPCLKYTNEEAKDFWVSQMAIDLNYTIGETYYFSLDVKGTGAEAITSGFQYAGKNNADEQVYWGCGDVTDFTPTSDWKTVVISGKAEAAQEGQAPGRWVANLGQYVGDLYITNVVVYTEKDGGETPDEPVTPPSEGKEVYSIDYSTTTWDFYVMGYTPQNENGVLVSNYPGEWYQYFIADRIATEAGKSYKAVVKIKTSSAASLALNMGWGWGEGEQAQGTLKTTTEWTEATYTFENVGGNSCNLVLQPGTYDGTVEIEWVKVYEVDGGETPDEPVTPKGDEIYSIDYSTTTWDFYVMGYTPQNENGVLVSNYPGEWYQYFIADRIATEEGKNYTAVVKIKTSSAASLALNMGWGWGEGEQAQGTLKTTTEWTEATYTFENIGGTSSNLVLQPGTYDGTVEIEWVKVYNAESSAVEEIAPAVENGRIVVYNLLGVKVLDTDDASQLNTLRKGIYIVNGKKVAL